MIIENFYEPHTSLLKNPSANSPQKSPLSNNMHAASIDNINTNKTLEQTSYSNNRDLCALNDLSGNLFVELNISTVKTIDSLNTHPILTHNMLK